MDHNERLIYLDAVCRLTRIAIGKKELHQILLLNELITKKGGEADLRDIAKLTMSKEFLTRIL